MWYPGMILFLSMMWLTGYGAAMDTVSQAKTERARTVLHFLIDGKYREFAEAGDEKMKAAMGPRETEQVWAGILAELGPYRSEESAKAGKVLGVYAVSFVCRLEAEDTDPDHPRRAGLPGNTEGLRRMDEATCESQERHVQAL